MIAREHSINNIFFLKPHQKVGGYYFVFLLYCMNFKRMEGCVLKIPNVSLSFLFSFFVIVHINYRMYFVGPCPQLVFSILYIFTRLCDYYLAEYGIGRNQNYGK